MNLLCLVGIVLAVFLVFRHLGGGSIDLSDESLTAGRSLSFYHDKNPFQLSINGEVSLRKPPLMYMLNALSFSVFGVNEFGLRFFNALFGIFTFLLIGFVTDRLYGRAYAGIAMLLLCGSSSFIDYCREALTDTAFVFGVVLASLAVARGIHNKQIETSHKIGYAAGVFIASFSKGLLILVVPIYAIIFLLLCRRALAMTLLVPTLFAMLPLSLWMSVELLTQPGFYHEFLGQEVIERLNPNSTYLPLQLHGPFWYLKKLWDWFALTGYVGLGVALAWVVLNNRLRSGWPGLPAFDSIVFLSGFSLFFVVSLSLSSHKRDAYMLSLFPVLSIVVAASVSMLVNSQEKHVRVRNVYLGVVVLAVTVGVLRTLITNKPIPDYRPGEKYLAEKIVEHGNVGIPVYTDDSSAARILHFYLDRVVRIVPSHASMASERALFVSHEFIAGASEVGSYFLVKTNQPSK